MKDIRIAIVDDEELFRAGLKMVISSFPKMEVILEAGDGSELLQKLDTVETPPDIILLDLKMKGMDGVETATILGQNYPDTKIIILSLHYTTPMVRHMVSLNVSAYIKKTINPNELQAAIHKVFSEGIYFTPDVYEILRKGYLTTKNSKPEYENTENLTLREKQILELICKEYTNQEIAEMLNLSARTVAGHRNTLLQKTKSKNTAGLVVYAIMNNQIDIKNLTEYKSKL